MEQKFNWKRLLITIGIVVFTAGVVGGTTYYVMGEQVKKDKIETDKQIAALEKQVSEVKTSTTDNTPTSTTDSTANWKNFSNDAWGFSFKYPTTYTVTANNVGAPGTLPQPGQEVYRYEIEDKSRVGSPKLSFIFNPDGIGGCMLDRNDYSYTSKIENGRLSITKKEKDINSPCDYQPSVVTMFGVGHGNYIGDFKNSIFAQFIYESGDYQSELDKIISTIRITKPEMYGNN